MKRLKLSFTFSELSWLHGCVKQRTALAKSLYQNVHGKFVMSITGVPGFSHINGSCKSSNEVWEAKMKHVESKLLLIKKELLVRSNTHFAKHLYKYCCITTDLENLMSFIPQEHLFFLRNGDVKYLIKSLQQGCNRCCPSIYFGQEGLSKNATGFLEGKPTLKLNLHSPFLEI